MKTHKLNREWHEAHRMPKNPTRSQRLEWHAEHSKHCGCRPVPLSLAADLRELKKKAAGRSN